MENVNATKKLLADALVAEYDLNGNSRHWQELNIEFCNYPNPSPDVTLCQSLRLDIAWACKNECDEGKKFCEDCQETIDSEKPDSESEGDDPNEARQIYIASAMPRF